jgi:putative Ig domain-containing protein
VVAAASFARILVAAALVLAVSGCGGGGGEEDPAEPAPSTDPNGAPHISGSPPATIHVGEPYTFRPTCIDPQGDDIRFTALRLPVWAQLDPHTGKLTGVPRAGDEGVYSGITIKVSDGVSEAALPAFAIEVSQNATGSATLSWTAPTQYTDGTPLTTLAGYRIEYGREVDDPDQFLLIDNPSANTVVIDRLSTGTWHFTVVAYDARSLESEPSALASQTIT